MILRSIVTSLLLVTSLSLGFGQSESEGVVIDEIITKVDNHIILKSELEIAYLDFIQKGQGSGQAAKCQVLENLVVSKLLLAKAEIDSVSVLDIEVESSLDRKMRYFVSQIGSEEKLEEYYGKSIDEFKEELREQEKEQLLIQRMQTKIAEDVEITPAEVQRFFRKIPSDSLPYFSKAVTVGQIVKYPEVGAPQKDQARRTLLSLRERLLAGENFGTLAKQYSQEPIAARTGGELGFFQRGELAPEYEAAALALQPGELSLPVESDFGFHLIQLIERRGNAYNSRHILLTPKPSLSDIAQAKKEMDSIRNLIQLDSIAFEQTAKDLSDDKITGANGGFLTDDTGSPMVSVENLDPNTFFALDTMKIGTISSAQEYKLPDGKDAVRIIYYKNEQKPHQANLKDDWQRIQAAALTEKKNTVLLTWFDKARFEVFIDIDKAYENCNILK